MTRRAPRIQAHRWATRPTGPQPKTATVSSAADVSHLRGLVPRGEDIRERAASSSDEVVGDLHRADVGEGDAHALGLAALVAAGGVRVAEDAAGQRGERVGVLAEAEVRSRWQKKHVPQAMLKGTTTRSPRVRVCTEGPSSSTTPVNSWPKMVPTRVSGT